MARVLGIVGGTGPESTVDYYRSIVASWQRRNPDGSYPRLIINSVEAGRIFRLLGEGDYSAVARDLAPAVGQLAAAGADVALLASNASHLAFDEIEAASPVPLIHIVDAARDAAQAEGHHRLGIFGTRFVMEAPMYPDRFAALGMTIVVPKADEAEYIHEKYFGELVRGLFLDGTRKRFVEIIARMRDHDAIDGLILGGTELALTLTEPSYADVSILNTARIHAEAAVDWLLGEGAGIKLGS
jgi:aspartate racemase